MRYSLLIFFTLLYPMITMAQTIPKESSAYNYRIIPFTFEPNKPNNLTIEIARGTYYNDDSFSKNIILAKHTDLTSLTLEVPNFNSNYTWRAYSTMGNVIDPDKYIFHHFKVLPAIGLDTNEVRIRVVQKSEQFKDAYVFVDYNQAMYDMEGKLVWFLPLKADSNNNKPTIRDMKLTPQGTITYVIDDRGLFEVNLNGDTLWKGPNNGNRNDNIIGNGHHEFTRLKNGHYMALCQNFALWKDAKEGDTIINYIKPQDIDSGKEYPGYNRTPMATLAEYDAKGHLVWSWKSSDYLNKSNLFYRKAGEKAMNMTAHENSFFFDEQKKCIYISARNLNRVLKISYPAGKILAVYGNNNSIPGMPSATDADLFCGQHSVKVGQKGNLYLYNNNTCRSGATPTIIVMKEPVKKNSQPEKIWEFSCPESANTSKGYLSGGNVQELPDGSFFVSMAYPDSKLFIVNKNKEVLWTAIAERYNKDSKTWDNENLYRASIITNKKDFEKLVWNAAIRK